MATTFPTPSAWLDALTLERLGRWLAPSTIAHALSHRFKYSTAPMLLRNGFVAATLRNAGRSYEASVGTYGVQAGLYGQCTCNRWTLCPHSTALLVDLALSPELRAALARGAPTEPLLEALAAKRAEAARRHALEQSVGLWLAGAGAPVEERPLLEWSLGVTRGYDTRHLPGGAVSFPSVELKARALGERASLSASDVLTRALLPDDRRVLALCHPMSRSRKGFEASGVSASMVLELLRARAAASGTASAITHDGSRAPVRFADTPLRLRLVRTQLARATLAHDAALAHTAPDAPAFAAARGIVFTDEELVTGVLDTARRVRATRPGTARDYAADERAAPAPPSPAAPLDALEGRWTSADGALDFSARDTVLFSGPFAFLWVEAQHTFFPVDGSVDLDLAWKVHVRPSIELPAEHAPEVYKLFRTRLRGRTGLLPPPEAMGLPPLETPELLVRIDGSPLDVRVHLEARYSQRAVDLAPGALVAEESARDPARNTEHESAALARVAATAGLRWDEPARAFAAVDDDAAAFWTHGVAQLREPPRDGAPPLSLTVAEPLRRAQVRRPLRAKLRLSLVGGLLETALRLDSDGIGAEVAAIRDALARKRRWVALTDGSIAELTEKTSALLSEALDALPDALAAGEAGSEGAGARVAPHQLGRLMRWADEFAAQSDVDPAVEALRARLKALAVAPAPKVPAGLGTTLRPYQLAGLAWLQFLRELGAGGVLADDMGLGKTVTALAMLLHCRQAEGPAPSLVVCPTSVAGNWLREAARFAPALRVVLLHGGAREARYGEVAAADLVVTTYALARIDAAKLGEIEFRYVLLDEAQNVKNADAATTHAVKRLRARDRLALTGTPVENRLLELWSIMDFCNPGMLGTRRDFEARFERAIVAESGAAPDAPASAAPSSSTAQGAAAPGSAAAQLRALVRPFVLRRSKSQVLTDLPPKEEIDQPCVLGPAQRKLYDALAEVVRNDVEATVARDGLAKSGLTVLSALLRLRQMACDPRLVDPHAPAAASAKREQFLELVRELVAEGRRALVFSQFVELLTLWRADLDREGIAYEYLDGKTRDRDAAVARFQQGASPLFLISLRAGGTGLNLTAADTVIHCDPWWNPAVEDQATDRAHRIGQARSVTVFRLIARGTVEDKIAVLKSRKRELADAVVRADEGALRGLSVDDVRTLLGRVEGEEAAPLEPDASAEPEPPVATPAPAPRRKRAAKK